jgi:hypothetical protein
VVESDLTVRFDLVSGDITCPDVRIPLSQFETEPGWIASVQAEPEVFRIFEQRTKDSKKHLRYRYTPDRVLFHAWRQGFQIQNLIDFRPFLESHLHYVGRSKQSDSFTQMYNNAHKCRLKILSLENPMRPGANLSDEMTLLVFKVDANEHQTSQGGDGIDDLFAASPDRMSVIADAEKAFVKILAAQHCDQKYKQYPLSTDGLTNAGLTRYFFMLKNPLPAATAATRFHGGEFFEKDSKKAVDSIAIEGSQVSANTFQQTPSSAVSPG